MIMLHSFLSSFILIFSMNFILFTGGTSVTTEEASDEDNYDSIEYQVDYQDIYKLLDVNGLNKELNKQGVRLDLNKLLDGFTQGDGEYIVKELMGIVKDSLVGDLLLNKNLMIQIVSLVLLGSIFVNLSGSFGTGFISDNGFYITYLIITSLMLTSFLSTIDMVSASISNILNLVRLIVPVYALAMNFVGHTAQSVGMYEVIMVGIWLVQVIILKFIIPLIKFYVIVSLINNLNKEDNFSKMSSLVKNLVGWLLKTIVVFVLGLNIVKGLIEPQIDALGRNTVNKVIAAIPGGGIMSVLTGTYLGAGMVVKNCIGVAGIIIILFALLVPIIKVFLIMMTVRITAVIIQPIGEKRYVEGVDVLAKGNALLLQTMGSSGALFMLTIAIVSFSAKGG